MSLITDIADAVAAEINAGAFLPAQAQRRVLPEFELAQLTEMKVSVVPKSMRITGATRVASQYEIAIDIGIQQKLPAGDTDVDAHVAALGSLVDQLIDYLRQRQLLQLPGVNWVSIDNEPVYAPEHLVEQRVFTSVLTVTYRAVK